MLCSLRSTLTARQTNTLPVTPAATSVRSRRTSQRRGLSAGGISVPDDTDRTPSVNRISVTVASVTTLSWSTSCFFSHFCRFLFWFLFLPSNCKCFKVQDSHSHHHHHQQRHHYHLIPDIIFFLFRYFISLLAFLFNLFLPSNCKCI